MKEHNIFYYAGLEQYSEEELAAPGTQPIVRPEPLIKADRLSYLLFERPDLDLQERFMTDFGLITVEKSERGLFMRARDSEPVCYVALPGENARYLGCGFTVNCREDLETLRQHADNAGGIESIDWPGGGERVRLTDPDGFIIDLIYGREPVEPLPYRKEVLPANTPDHQARINAGQRPEFRPTQVVRLGHTVHMVTDYQLSVQWYMKHVGIIPSDVQCLEGGEPIMSFNRLDRGEKPADHHTLALLGGPVPRLAHAAFEAVDLDELGQGSEYLYSQGWTHNWGIGRHTLGSQLFDYWQDPFGAELEHYADGDLFTADHPTGYGIFDKGMTWMWGDSMPRADQPAPVLPETVLRPESRKETLLKWCRAMDRQARPWIKLSG